MQTINFSTTLPVTVQLSSVPQQRLLSRVFYFLHHSKMDKWLRISLQLCLYGFFNGIQPSTQFNFRILNEFRGLPKSEVSSFFYVQLIYWRFGLGLLAFLFTDISRYKPSIIISSLSALIGFTTMRCTTERNLLYVCG